MKVLGDRFWSKVSKDADGCWRWTAGPNGSGYGVAYIGQRRRRYAHRLAYECLVGPIPEGLELDHLCRTTLCVNPAHLDPVTHAENMRRGVAGKRSQERAIERTHCHAGHPFTNENTYRWAGDKFAKRRCQECQRQRQRAYRSRTPS